MSGIASGINSSPPTISRILLDTASESRMSSPKSSRRGLAGTLKKVGRIFCLGASQVSPTSEPGVQTPVATKPTCLETALRPRPEVPLHVALKIQQAGRKKHHQRDYSTACRRREDQLVKKVAEKDALCARLLRKAAQNDAACAQKDAVYAHLEQKNADLELQNVALKVQNAALEERAVPNLVGKMMARASFHASEELRTQEKAMADERNASLRQEKEQVLSICLQLGKKLKTVLEENTSLRADLEQRMERSCADMAQMQATQEKYSALLQQCQHMVAQVDALRQANAALEGRLLAARKAAALKDHQMEKARQKETRAQARVQQLEAVLEEAHQKEEAAEEEKQELKDELAQEGEQNGALMKENVALREWGKEAMAESKQLEGCLRRASRLPLLPLAEGRLVAHAGDGAQSSVDLHELNGTLIAVKKPESEIDERSLLLEEATLADMDHSAIPKPLTWLTMDDGRQALGLPAFTGGSLRDLLGSPEDSGKALSMVEGMSLIKQGAEALQYVHSSGYVHSDIKPSNLMLDAEGRLAIIDWGSAYNLSERPQIWGGSNGYVRPAIAASAENMGPEDDIRGLCAVGLELATGQGVGELLRSQYDSLYSSDESSSDEEVAQKEEAKGSITAFCESHSGLDPLDFMDRFLVAEYLGYISIKEEDFEPYLIKEAAPCEYLRLLLRAVSHAVGCGEAPMPTLQDIRDAISSYLQASCGPSSKAALA